MTTLFYEMYAFNKSGKDGKRITIKGQIIVDFMIEVDDNPVIKLDTLEQAIINSTETKHKDLLLLPYVKWCYLSSQPQKQ